MGYVQIGNRTFTKSMPIGTSTNDQLLPFPSILVQGTNTGPGGTQITDLTKNFISIGITPGMVAMALNAQGASRTITNVTATQLTLSGNIFIAAGETYIVYPAGGIKGTPYDGAIIKSISTGSATFTVETLSREVMNVTLQSGGDLPIQISRIVSNTNAFPSLIALY